MIDEAGQFCLANTIAVASAAANLMLLGDPQQLPQVSQGHTPNRSTGRRWAGSSRSPALPDERGYFLDRSHRMHPAVCGPVSGLAYEGRLHRTPSSPRPVTSTDIPPGCASLLSPTTATQPRARRKPRRSWRDPAAGRLHGRTRTAPVLRPDDVLVFARTTRRCCCCGTDCGRPARRCPRWDRRQVPGAQAPVVFVSMTASSIEDVPRGIPSCSTGTA